MTYRNGSKYQGRWLLTTVILLTSYIAALLLTGAVKPGGSGALVSAARGCPAGAERVCLMPGGGRGIQFCSGTQWSRCTAVVDPTPIPTGTGTVRPKFYVLTVVYAPPGTDGGRSSSSVTYGSGSGTGTTVTSSNSFKQNYSVTVSTEVGLLGTGGSVGASFGYGRNSTNAGAIDIRKSASTEISDSGPTRDGIDHDRDIIYLWLNPSLDVTVTPTSANWKLSENTTADIQYLYVGWLKNPSLIPPGVAQRLQSRGITSQDFPVILSADPFANGGTAIDSRRYLPAYTTFPYEPPFAQGEPVPTFKFVLSNANAETTTSSLQKDYTLGASVSGGGSFFGLFTVSVKDQNSWTWSCIDTRSATASTSESASATVGGPSFGYTGPTDIKVYYDTLYKTFVFVPMLTAGIPSLRGSIMIHTGHPASGREVTVVANGVKYRTFTNARGEYRVFGRISGPLQLKVGTTVKNLPAVPASREANLSVPQ